MADARAVQSVTDALKVPPHSQEAEQAVLGGLMLDNSAFDRVADRIAEDDFYRRDHRLIFRCLKALAEAGRPADVVTVSEWLKAEQCLDDAGGLSYLGSLARDTPSAANIQAYADIVRERSVLRQLIQAGTEITSVAFNPEGRGSAELLETAERLVFQIAEQTGRTKQGFVSVKDVLPMVVDRIDQLSQQGSVITGLATGWNDFDTMTSGFQPGDLVIVAARPAMGKTTFSMNIAEHAAMKSQHPVAVFSMEMPAEQLAIRMLSSLGRIEMQRIRTGKLADEDWPRLTSTLNLLSQAKMFIDDTPALSPTEMRARTRRLKREHGLGLVVVDYLQLMQVPGFKENRTAEISEISRSLKAMAKELSVPVIALSQLNRSLEQRPNKRPVMSDLRECVTGDTLVCLADGRRRPIRELVGQAPEVLAVDDADRVIAARADLVWSVGERPLRELRLASGRRLRASGQHRVRVWDGWKTMDELAPGDRVALARTLPEPESAETWPDAHLILLGHLVGDGSYLSGQPLRYTTASEANSAAVSAAAESFGVVVNRHGGRGRWHQLVFSGNGNRWHPKGINRWLRELGIFGQRSAEKRLPPGVFGLANRQIALLLRHLWATDGSIHVRKPGERGAARIYFATASEGLARDVAALLLRFGIVARIRAAVRDDRLWTVDISGGEQQRLFLDRIGAFGPREVAAQRLREVLDGAACNPNVDTLPREAFAGVRAAMQAQGISQRRMTELRGTSYGGTSHFRFAPSRAVLRDYARHLNDPGLAQAAESDLYWDRVVEVVDAGVEEVFDLTVPGPANWLSDGVVSHNSGAIEQDADIIVFIYRDEVYNEDSPDKGTAEIIIGKQRNGPIGSVRLTFLGKYTRFENFIENVYAGDAYQ